MMRILVLTHNYVRTAGDFAGLFVHTLNKALLRHGHEITVICPHAPGTASRERLEGIDIIRFRYMPGCMENLAYRGTMHETVRDSPLSMLAFASFMLSFLSVSLTKAWGQRTDIVHAHWWFPAGCIAFVISILLGMPYIVTIHGTDAHIVSRNRVLLWLFRRVMKRAGAVAVGSEYLRGIVGRNLGTTAGTVAKLEKIPMPVEVPPLLKEGGETTGTGPILAVGRLTAQKNVGALIEALRILKDEGFRCGALVIGDGPLRHELEGMIARYGLGEAVQIISKVGREELFEHYRHCSLFVLPSVGEGLGLVLVEALLMKRPVIAAKSGGGTEVIDDGITGLLFDVNDPRTLAHSIRKLLEDRVLAARIARTGHEKVLRSFAPEHVAREYARLYAKALERRLGKD